MAAKLPIFAPFAADTARVAAEVLTKTRARAKKKSEIPAQMAADNALAVIAEVAIHHQPTIATVEMELWGAWLAGLPCQEDDMEAIRNNKILLALAQRQYAPLLGEGGRNAARIAILLLDAYNTGMVTPETSAGAGQYLLAVGEACLEGYAAQFTARQKKKLQRVLREAKAAAATPGGAAM